MTRTPALALVATAMLGATALAQLEAPPRTCDPAPTAYPPPRAPPVVRTWGAAALPRDWRAPPCVGWDTVAPTVVVALLGSVVARGGADAIVARFGAISRLRGVPYRSTMDRRWETLIVDAEALDGPHGAPRGDFAPAELVSGRDVYFRERDNRASAAVIYRMRVLVRSPDRVVVTIANVTPVKKLLVTFFAPGELQATYVLTRLSGDHWGFFGLSGARATGVAALGSAEASYTSRALAMFQHLAMVD